MPKYLLSLSLLLAAFSLGACDATETERFRMVSVQYTVEGYIGPAAAATITYTDADGTTVLLQDEPLPFQQTLLIQAGSEVTLTASLTAPAEQSGVALRISAGGRVIGEEVAAGSSGMALVSRELVLTRIVE